MLVSLVLCLLGDVLAAGGSLLVPCSLLHRGARCIARTCLAQDPSIAAAVDWTAYRALLQYFAHESHKQWPRTERASAALQVGLVPCLMVMLLPAAAAASFATTHCCDRCGDRTLPSIVPIKLVRIYSSIRTAAPQAIVGGPHSLAFDKIFARVLRDGAQLPAAD